jgi:DHA1 family tetracycline resistance protein-like MFS transporter
MIFGLCGGAVGIALMGWAPTGVAFIVAMFPNALWGLAMPTLQSLMTRRVGESEQGQLQGANMSVASIAGVASPLFFGWIYSVSVGEGGGRAAAWLSERGLPAVSAAADVMLSEPGLAFYLASAVLALGALIGFLTARRAERDEVTSV